MERHKHPLFGKEYVKARLPEKVTNPDLLKRGKVFEDVLINYGDTPYDPNYLVILNVNLNGDVNSPQVVGFSINPSRHCMSHGMVSNRLSDLNVGINEVKGHSFLLETDFPDVPEELLKTMEAKIIEVNELKKRYEKEKAGSLSVFMESYINRIPKVV